MALMPRMFARRAPLGSLAPCARMETMSDARVPKGGDGQQADPTAAAAMPCFVAAYDVGPALVFASERFRALGGAPGATRGQAPEAAPGFDAAARERLATLVRRALAGGGAGGFDCTLPDARGLPRLHHVEVTPERDDDGRIAGALVIGRDIAGTASTLSELQQRERTFRSLAENAGDTILRWSPQAVTLYVNPALDRLYQGRGRDFIGRRPSEAAQRNVEPMRALEQRVLAVATSGRPDLFDLPLRDPKGHQRVVHQLRIVPEFDEQGRVVSVLGIGRDVTQTVVHVEHIEALLHVDALTQLANRRALKDRSAELLHAARGRGARVGLLLLDLDRFKSVNDSLGHGVGDQLLVATGRRLQSCTGPQDLLVRLGGDEFVLLVPDVADRDGLLTLARRLHDAVGEPLALDGHALRITTSIGLALFPDDAASVEDLLARADAAMYEAKRAGRGRTAG